jgi:hypothetical protein
MSTTITIRSRKPEAVFCFIFFIVSLVGYYPGFIAPDTLDQYGQSLSHDFGDWHPPLMAKFWSLFNYIHEGSWSMLLFQLSLFWTAAYYLLVLSRRWWWILSIIIFLFLGSTQNYVAYLVKDAQMGLCWLLASAIMLRVIVEDRQMDKLEIIITAFTLLYGAVVRINSFPGFLPLAYIWSVVYLRHASVLIHLRNVGVYVVVILFVNMLLNIGVTKNFNQNKLYLHDMTGMMAHGHTDVFPQWMYDNPKFDTTYIRQKYHPATFDELWWNGDGKTFYKDTTVATSNSLRSAWVSAIASHPREYFANRLDGFKYYLYINKRNPDFMNFFPWIHPNPYNFHIDDNKFITKFFIVPVNRQKKMPYMYPMFWVITNILLFPVARVIRNREIRKLYLALALSSLLYLLPQFFIFQADGDFRYFYWNCIACSLSLLILIGSKANLFRPVSS